MMKVEKPWQARRNWPDAPWWFVADEWGHFLLGYAWSLPPFRLFCDWVDRKVAGPDDLPSDHSSNNVANVMHVEVGNLTTASTNALTIATIRCACGRCEVVGR